MPGVESGMTAARLILCASVHHGNTARVARAMADVLGAEIVAPADAPGAALESHDLMGFGSGVYYGRMHDALFDWLHGLPDARGSSRKAFVFSTSGLPWLAPLWHLPLKRLLTRKGFEVVGEFACRGYDTWGPLWLTGGLNRTHPDERDLARAREFASRLIGGGGSTAAPGR